MNPVLARTYLVISVLLAAFFARLLVLVTHAAPGPVDPHALLPPVFALVLLTAVVWLAMLVVRNANVALGKVSMRYYQTYREGAPPEWVERPARTFMNLLEVPVLFYVACLMMLATNACDAAQVALAWTFVGTRVLHAIIYMAWNYVPARFAAYVIGCVTLGVIWTRLAYALL
jgi:hypothetical protein